MPIETELVDALVSCGFEESQATAALEKMDRIRDFEFTYPVRFVQNVVSRSYVKTMKMQFR